jgi:hypothetical protein
MMRYITPLVESFSISTEELAFFSFLLFYTPGGKGPNLPSSAIKRRQNNADDTPDDTNVAS